MIDPIENARYIEQLHREIETLHKQLQSAREFHPRAMKLIEKQKPFLVVACDEPYYQYVYAGIRQHEIEIGRWTQGDELIYRSEIDRLGKDV